MPIYTNMLDMPSVKVADLVGAYDADLRQTHKFSNERWELASFLLCSLMIVLLVMSPEPARAGSSTTAEVRFRASAPVTLGSEQAKFNFHTHFSSMTALCFTFVFEGDLFDPGDIFLVDFGPSLGAFGATNIGTTSGHHELTMAGDHRGTSRTRGRSRPEVAPRPSAAIIIATTRRYA